MEDDIQNCSPTVMFRGTPCIWENIEVQPYHYRKIALYFGSKICYKTVLVSAKDCFTLLWGLQTSFFFLTSLLLSCSIKLIGRISDVPSCSSSKFPSLERWWGMILGLTNLHIVLHKSNIETKFCQNIKIKWIQRFRIQPWTCSRHVSVNLSARQSSSLHCPQDLEAVFIMIMSLDHLL